jgi:probable O-glycosylation ligase (exosortase A-associated)
MLRTLFILGLFIPGFYASLRNRYAALLMYLWFALFRPQDWLWIDITSLRLSLVLGLVLFVPALLTGIAPNITHPLSIGMLSFLGSALLSQWSAVHPALGWQWIDFVARLFIACLLLVTLSSDARRLAGVVAIIGGSIGFHAGKAGLAFLLGGGTRFADGLAGAFVDNNGYALGTVMVMPLLLAAAQNTAVIMPTPVRLQTWIRRGFYVAVPFCALAVIGTYSRGGFLSLCAASLAYLLCQRQRFKALAWLVVVLALVVAFVPIPKSYVDRLETIRTYEKVGEDSALSRPHFWKVGLRMGMANTFGVGLRQYEVAYDKYDYLYGRFGHKRAVHSAHVQVFAELGALGAFIWAGMFAYAFYACLRVRLRAFDERLTPEEQRLLFTVANACIASMVGFIVGGSFLALALNDLTWLTFGLVAALDRLSLRMLERPAPVRIAARPVHVPLAFRAFESVGTARGAAC